MIQTLALLQRSGVGPAAQRPVDVLVRPDPQPLVGGEPRRPLLGAAAGCAARRHVVAETPSLQTVLCTPTDAQPRRFDAQLTMFTPSSTCRPPVGSGAG
ncbi:hypothetical protein HBB16_03895 [Pseudonocardia sp. MCCB 268]|nr:hypothetical protein [Pseudonocardia cytotoxica]